MADPRRAIFRITGPDIELDTVEVADGKTLKLGRLAANDLTLKHQKISRYHAEITLSDAGLFVTDLGSSNGTRVGDTPLEPEKPFQLNQGDSVQLGPFVLTVDDIIEPEAEKEPPPLDKTVETPVAKLSHLEPTRAVSTEAVQEAVAKAEEEKAKAKATEKIEPEDIEEQPEEEIEEEAEPEEVEDEKKPSKPKRRRKKAKKEETPPEPEPEAEPEEVEEEEEKPEVVAEEEEPTVKPDETPAEEEEPPEVTPDQATIAAQGTEPQPEVEEVKEEAEPEPEPEPKMPAPEPEKPKAAEKFEPPPPTIPPRIPLPVLADGGNGVPPVPGVPADTSSWMQYLPAIYSDDLFTGRFLLIFESVAAPLEWIVDHFDFFLDARYAPPEWLQWFGSWADILVPGSIPEARQRQIVAELSDLYKARGTPKSLARHLELVFDVKPDIKEPKSKPSTFEVVLTLGKADDTEMNRKLASRIIEAHRPAHTQFTLTIK